MTKYKFELIEIEDLVGEEELNPIREKSNKETFDRLIAYLTEQKYSITQGENHICWNLPERLTIIGDGEEVMEAMVLSGLPYELIKGTLEREGKNNIYEVTE